MSRNPMVKTDRLKKIVKKQKIKWFALAASVLLLGGVTLGQTEEVSAASDSYIINRLNGYASKGSTTYTFNGYFSIWGGASNTTNSYGDFRDTYPQVTVVNSMYNPVSYTYRQNAYIDMYMPVSDWGFVPGRPVWSGSVHWVSTGSYTGYQRSIRTPYTRTKTTPTTHGAAISGYDYKTGNEYWVKQGNSVQAKVHGRQYFQGTKFRWDDYVTRNYLNLVGHGNQIKGRIEYTGSYSNVTTHSDITISGSGAAQQNNDRDLYTTFNVRGNKHNTRYEFQTYARSANGRTHGYVGTNKYLNVDGEVPTDHGAKVFNARHVSGNDHWIRPGETVVVEAQGYDRHSRMERTNLRIFSSGHDNRARHIWPAAGMTQYNRTGTYTDITGGTVDYWSWTTRYHFNVRANTNSGNRTFNIGTFHNDNVGNQTGWTTSNQRIRTDATAPTITANVGSRSWGNGNQTVTLTHSDGQSGIKSRQYAWSTSTSTPSSWSTYSSAVTQSNQGTWYLHARAVDNVDRVTTERFGPYRIDKTAPNGSISGNPTSWTNQDVTLTFNGSDTGGSGTRRVRIAGGTWVNGSTTSRTVSSNGTYSFEVEDNAGNTRTVSVTVDRIDKTTPESRGTSIFHARYVNGNDHWVRPGEGVLIEAHGYEKDSRMRNTNLRLYGDGNDNRAEYQWYARPIDVREYQTTGGYTSIYDGSEYNWGWTAVYRFNVRANTNAGNRTFNVYTYYRDNADNLTGWIDSGLNLRTDATAPTISANPASSAWSNGNQTVTLTHADGQSGIATRQYAWSTSTATPSSWSDYSSAVTQSAQGTWYLHARAVDNVDRVTTQRFGPYRIDKTLPNATSSQSPTGWTNGNVNITWNASATNSPLSRVRVHNGTWGAWSAVSGSSSSTVQTVTSNGTYHFQIQDQAGNVRQISRTINNIDKGVPDIRSSQSPTAWTNGNVTLTLGARDFGEQNGQSTHISGIASIQVRRPDGTTWNDTYGAASEGSQTYYNRTFTATENGTYTVTVTDRAGNSSTHNHTVSNIDRSTPSGSTNRQSGWTNGNVWIDVTGRNAISGLASIRYVSGGSITGNTTYPFTGTTSAQTVRFTATQNGTYTFDITDRAGNVRRVTQVVDTIDRTVPHGSTTQTPTAWTNQNVTLRVAGGDTNAQGPRISGVERVRMRPVGSSSWAETRTVSDSTESSPNFNPLSFTITDNGRYQFEIRDRAGNIRVIEHTVSNIDRSAPDTDGSFTPNGWTNGTITITWEARRTGSPGAPLEAYRYDRGNGNWTAWQNATHADAFDVTQQVSSNGVYRFEVRDEAGNIGTSSVTVTQHDIVLPVGQITARFDRSERDDHVGYTSNDLVNMVDSRRVTVDVTGVEDLGISGVESVAIEEQHRIGYGGAWMTVDETTYNWPDPYSINNQTYAIDVDHAQDTRFVLTVTDRAGNSSTRATSNVVRQSVLQAIDFRITDVVNPQLSDDDVAAIQASDLTSGSVELTAGTNVTFDVTYQLRHLDTVDQLSGNIVIETVSPEHTHTHVIDVDEPLTGHNQHNTFTKTFTVPQGTPKGSEVNIYGNLVAEMANGTAHEISYPDTYDIGVIENHIEEFFRFRIVR